MFKTSLLLKSASGLDPFTNRGEMATQRLQQLCPTAEGFVQARALNQDAAFAGVLDLWFTDSAAALAAGNQSAKLAPLWRDKGVDVAAVVVGLERVVMRLPSHHTSPAIKGVFPFRRKLGMSVADFQHHWWHNHGPIAALTENALYYTQSHVLPQCYATHSDDSTPAYDGITELYWPSRAIADAAMDSRQMREDQAQDADNFVDKDSIGLFFAEIETLIPA